MIISEFTEKEKEVLEDVLHHYISYFHSPEYHKIKQPEEWKYDIALILHKRVIDTPAFTRS